VVGLTPRRGGDASQRHACSSAERALGLARVSSAKPGWACDESLIP
jgi:hypothetical protein